MTTELLPVSLPDVFSSRLRDSRRPPDGKLHCSSDLVGSLRHSQLRAAGAPERPSTTADDVVLMTGTLWHSWANEALLEARLPVMQEVKLDRWMPEGWSGTADWVFWSDEHKGFVLGDLKTIKGDGIPWIIRDGTKPEHLWQLSAYYWALVKAGFPMVKGVAVLYWPKDRGTRSDASVVPTVQECEPFGMEVVLEQMQERWQLTKAYLADVDSMRTYAEGGTTKYVGWDAPHSWFLRDSLAPEQERVQKVAWNAAAGGWDLRLVPHWSAAYCPFEAPLCGCSEHGITKIGSYSLDGLYTPRKGYQESSPLVQPDQWDIARRRKGAQ